MESHSSFLTMNPHKRLETLYKTTQVFLMKILLLSAYHAQSHARWCRGLVNSTNHVDWTVLTLPGRRFSWRYPGNAYSWFMTQRDVLQQHYDLVVCTSMVNIAVLRGLFPNLAHTRCVVYCHENQFAYPLQHEIVQRDWLYFAIQNLYTVLAGDVILFNSEYNKTTLLEGIRKLLKKMPDFAPRNCIPEVEAKSQVLPVPIEEEFFQPRTQSIDRDWIHLVWNHRWEYDKGPDILLHTLRSLVRQGTQFKLSLVGQQFSRSPDSFATIQSEFNDHLLHFGFVESKSKYQQILKEADCILSTAKHDFQGLAMMDAIGLGCTPLAPNRLAYPEYIPTEYLYSVSDSEEIEGQTLARKIQGLKDTPKPWNPVNISSHTASALWPKYHKVLNIGIHTDT